MKCGAFCSTLCNGDAGDQEMNKIGGKETNVKVVYHGAK